MNLLNVYLLRHGQTQWNAEGNKYCGRTDIPLTEKGVEQAGLARERLKGLEIDAVYSSPLERARHTAEIAGGGKTVCTDERLIEVDFGRWEGKTREAFIRENKPSWDNWCRDPMVTRAGETGETAREVIRRVDDFFTSVLKLHGNPQESPGSPEQPAGIKILVVGHNGINRLYLAWKLGMHVKDYRRLVQENSTITLFSLDENAELTLHVLNSK